MRMASAVLTLSLVTLTGSSTGAQSPEIRARIDAYVRALSSGSPEQFEAMAKEHCTPELLDRTSAQRQSMVTRLHDDFGEISIAHERISNPAHVELEMKSPKN